LRILILKFRLSQMTAMRPLRRSDVARSIEDHPHVLAQIVISA
jgi:hypothetical protein